MQRSNSAVADDCAVPSEAPKALVLQFLAALEARDLAAAEARLAPGFTMTFPGTGPMTTLAELIAWAKPRYTRVGKTIDAVEVFEADVTTVYVRGTLYGAWPDGAPFQGIRFIDRFEVVAGKITRQEVWNDLAEVRGS